MHIWRFVGEGYIRIILLKTDRTLLAVTIRVSHAADCSNIAWLELCDSGADLSKTINMIVRD
jgi:hypothetical protein